jgi:signal transduction histidine kinase
VPASVDDIAEVIRWVQFAEWTLLALAAINVWRTQRTAAATWLALTFGTIALVVVAGLVLPDDQTQLTIPVRALLAVLALFPYLLYRFVTSMVERQRWAWIAAHVLTAAAVVGSFFVSSVPEPGEPRPLGLVVFLVVFVAEWSFLLVRSAWRLWRAGSGQPVVARKRMRTMAAAASMLALVIVISASGSSGAEERPLDVIVSAIGLLAAPLFFLGFDPPRFLRLLWRQREEAALRDTEIGLVRAISRPEVANAWLPRVSELVGGNGAVVFDMDRSVLATHNFAEEDVRRALAILPPADAPRYSAIDAGPYQVLTMHNGWLAVAVGPLTPFFGDDELRMLAASSVVADLALGRARLFELERQSREAMRDFVAIASHDLRTPVTVIAGFTDLMQMRRETVSDEQKQEYLNAITRQVTHLHRLIDDLLTVSKLDVRELEVFRRPVDVGNVAREVVEELGMDAEVMAGDPGGHVRALADADHVARMVRNYLTNARIYGYAPISVHVAQEDGSVVVRVRDAGPGVPADFVPRLFEKFARLDKKKSRAVQGTGLGLSIVRGLAHNNGGEAWYEPNEPTGACFCFRLPVVPMSDEAVHA